jgi:CheY-like chemotaxis protein
MRILLVDDEPTVRAIVAELLELEGHAVVQAENGPDGLAVLANDGGVELVLADVGMPRMNGWALAREVRARYPSVRVGLITGYGSTGPSDPAERAVVDFIIAKPITDESLQVIRRPRGA